MLHFKRFNFIQELCFEKLLSVSNLNDVHYIQK